MKNRKALINEFIQDAEVMGLKCDPVFTFGRRLVSIDVFSKDRNPVLEIDFDNHTRIYPLKNVKVIELDQYSWLFSRASELLHDLEKISKKQVSTLRATGSGNYEN